MFVDNKQIENQHRESTKLKVDSWLGQFTFLRGEWPTQNALVSPVVSKYCSATIF